MKWRPIGARRTGFIAQDKRFRNFHVTVSHGLETEHSAVENQMINVICGIINGNVYQTLALWDPLEIIHALVLNPHQIWATLLRCSQAEVAAGACFSVCH